MRKLGKKMVVGVMGIVIYFAGILGKDVDTVGDYLRYVKDLFLEG